MIIQPQDPESLPVGRLRGQSELSTAILKIKVIRVRRFSVTNDLTTGKGYIPEKKHLLQSETGQPSANVTDLLQQHIPDFVLPA